MTFVVTEPCIKCKYGDCVDVCPVDAFHEGPNFMVIDPVECIDCSVCVVECPVSAIFDEADLPPEYTHYIALNAELSRTWPLINSAGEPLADADKWSEVKEKFKYLEVPVTA